MTHSRFIPITLLLAYLTTLALTMVPTVYAFDSAEFAIGASELGLVHTPGYPLYLIVAHLFTRLPLPLDTAAKVNLLSVVSLALAVPAVYMVLRRLLGHAVIAAGTALIFGWSYYVWSIGIAAEIYAPQLATLAWTAALLTIYPRNPLPAGVMYGVALATHPGSILFAPGVGTLLLMRRYTWQQRISTGGAVALMTTLPLLYFPLRWHAQPTFNMLGVYQADGTFAARDLSQWQNILWVLRGGQFDSLFLQPNLGTVTSILWANYLGAGVIIGLLGLWVLAREQRHLLGLWLVWFLPFAAFYANYGAPDIETMLGPLHMLWTVPLAFGLHWLLSGWQARYQIAVITLLALTMLLVNYPLVDGSNETSIRARAEAALDELPTDSVVFGNWFDIVPLQYLQIVEGQRPDITLHNLFLFEEETLTGYLEHLQQYENRVFFIGEAADFTGLNVILFVVRDDLSYKHLEIYELLLE